MTPLTIVVLRRLSVYALCLAALLVVVPRVLGLLGVIGPSPVERLAAGERAVAAARSYGADESSAALKAALLALDEARSLNARGERLASRRATDRAVDQAIAAQRQALADAELTRRRAEALVEEIDAALNGLDDLYSEVSRGLPRSEVTRLLSLIKSSRQAGAVLFLAYEQGNMGKVVAEGEAVKRQLGEARAQLAALRKH
jgi:hypothetical protein